MSASIITWQAWRSATFEGARARLQLPASRRAVREADIPHPGFLVADCVALGRGRFDVLLVAESPGR
jgi:hypothetical protein